MTFTIRYSGVDFGAGFDRIADRALRSAERTMVGDSVNALLAATGGWITEAASVRGHTLAGLLSARW